MRSLLAGLVGFYCVLASAEAQQAATFGPEVASTFKILRLEGNNVRWLKPAAGAGPIVSYRILTAAQEFPGARNCRNMTGLDEVMAASSLTLAAVRREIAAALEMWQEVADISFREADEGAPADILIGAQLEPEGWAFADVFYDAASAERIKPISRALVCLNPTKRWKIGFDGDLKTYDLRYTVAHEIGHAIGLDHPTSAGQIMGYRYEERFRALQPGDVKGAIALYGERQRPGVTVASDRTGARPITSARRYAKRWGTRAFTARSQRAD